MLRALFFVLLLAISFAVNPAFSAEAEATTPSCTLTEADKAANAQLSFDDFDQSGVTPATWRQLSDRHCDTASVEAAEDYLVRAANLSQSQRQAVAFHIAQSLGMIGDYKAAALMVAIAKQPPRDGGLDWNTYLDGTWAFFKRNRPSLEKAKEQLLAEPGIGNQLNASALTGLLNCFDKPYGDAYQQDCRVIGDH